MCVKVRARESGGSYQARVLSLPLDLFLTTPAANRVSQLVDFLDLGAGLAGPLLEVLDCFASLAFFCFRANLFLPGRFRTLLAGERLFELRALSLPPAAR